MIWKLDTIGKRLFIAFSVLALNVIIISILSYQFLVRNRALHDVTRNIGTERVQIMLLLKTDLDFLRFEVINQQYYETNHSHFLQVRDSLYDLIKHENVLLKASMLQQPLGVAHNMDTISQTLRAYNNTFQNIRTRIAFRGFKDYGIEGKMRRFAHELERHSDQISTVNVLTLRRHEKDYFLRKEPHYKRQFNALANQLIQAHAHTPDSFVVHLLRSYQDNFNQLAAVDEEIGLTPTQGLLGELNTLSDRISQQLHELVMQAEDRADHIMQQSLVIFILVSLLTVFISFILTYFTTRRLARPIKKLSHTISRYMVNQGLNEDELKEVTVTNEINNLSGAFIKMTRKLKAQFDEIQRKSHLLEKRNGELQKLNEELDRFIYSSAHDLKSPLASMAGLVHLAQREMNVPEHNHYFEKMRLSIEKMEGFIRDITDYAKNKRQQIRPEKINLAGILDDIFQSFQFIPQSELIDKRIDIRGSDLYTDKTRLEIILKNLISNAIRYADPTREHPYIHIDILCGPHEATIRIADNGIGIGEEHVSKIFDMFYRANDHAKGSGIGLFLVRESVKMLRGTIGVESVLGEGTVFVLHLPSLTHADVDLLPETEPVRLAPQFRPGHHHIVSRLAADA